VSTATQAVPFVPWEELERALDWRQGEHLTAVGPTGCGKSTLLMGLLPRRDYVVVVGTKPRDRTLDRLRRQGYRLTREWPPAAPPTVAPRVLFWPRIDRMGDRYAQAAAIATMLESVYRTGGWTVVLDELRYITDPRYLGLESQVVMLYTQARALGVSVVGGTQRPRYVPLDSYSAATHLFLWRSSDRADLRRLSELDGADVELVRAVLPHLQRHEALYVNTRDGEVFRTQYAL
jgi:hypothetical protein